MKNKLILALLCLCAINFLTAQENLPTNNNNQLDFESSENKWSFGLIANGSVSLSKREFELNNFEDRDTELGYGLGAFADYKINQQFGLRSEIGVNATGFLRPYLNLQAEHFIGNNWSLYAGAGIYYNPDTTSVFKRDRDGELGVNPFLLIGTRYRINPKWAIDLRYQHDLLPRAKGTGSIGDFTLGGNRTISLGVNYRF
ncbi:putative outer membrane protein [Nonlabens dokdonensis]|jgi:opacity protein-like surface antigen|uniref:OmpA_membrane domain containing protein n=2 Tax=Nonlabens dokdonensis TaxID=328515 RepID=L7WAS0_NONDD|nr:outer membrane beta-barrel protein [Nonlabens dokdonensis]AGC77282.1 OmpA_membrane domain containing protein [Nonlabens dokdonensis DSW-6]PZX40817.1 putative outer membrane protein [Nonlabens dokdonensis]